MILGSDRMRVVERIRTCYEAGDFHAKTELDDPLLSPEESKRILDRFEKSRKSPLFPLKREVANLVIALGQWWFITKDTKIVGKEKLKGLKGGAVVTSNHFSQFENCVLRHLAIRKHKRLYVVSQVGNLEIPGFLGFLLHNTDLIPLGMDASYLHGYFVPTLKSALERGDYVLIYPEQEMWWGWRRPRPCKRGAYYYACECGKPVISCFVEIRDKRQMDKAPFHKVRYTLHVLGVLYPPQGKSPREASAMMAQEDYRLKKEAYERIYQKPVDAPFSPDDIAGWDGSN